MPSAYVDIEFLNKTILLRLSSISIQQTHIPTPSFARYASLSTIPEDQSELIPSATCHIRRGGDDIAGSNSGTGTGADLGSRRLGSAPPLSKVGLFPPIISVFPVGSRSRRINQWASRIRRRPRTLSRIVADGPRGPSGLGGRTRSARHDTPADSRTASRQRTAARHLLP